MHASSQVRCSTARRESVARAKLMRRNVLANSPLAPAASIASSVDLTPQEGVVADRERAKQLDGELDVSRTAAPELELARRDAGELARDGTSFSTRRRIARALASTKPSQTSAHVGCAAFLERARPTPLVSAQAEPGSAWLSPRI